MPKTIRGLELATIAALALSVGSLASAPAAAQAVITTTATTPPATAQAPAAAPDKSQVPATVASAADAPASTPAGPAKAPDIVHMAPTPGIGMPTDSIGLQPQVTPIGHEAVNFHNYILVPMMGGISLLVLLLLLWVVVRYRASANPVPSRTSHNTVIEVVWTLMPVLILVLIAVPSIRLLAHQYNPPKADITIKAIGNQWYWTYQYPDNGDFEVVSNMLKEKGETSPKEHARTDADGPKQLAVDERMVVPAGKVVKIITTSNDVIHSFAMPAFWTKMDAIPGRLNETWFKVDRPGVYFGQCSELCGARHGFMPIAIEVVPPAQFAQWVAFKGGTMPGARPANNPDATKPTSPAIAAPAAKPPFGSEAPNVKGAGVEKPAVTSQGTTQNQGSNND